jgi:hypothetical protein
MGWLLVAVVMFAGSTTPDFKINTALKFINENRCVEYVKLYENKLKGGLHRAFPTIVRSDLICVDFNTAKEMQEEMIKRGR